MGRYTVSRSGADCKSAVFGLGWCNSISAHHIWGSWCKGSTKDCGSLGSRFDSSVSHHDTSESNDAEKEMREEGTMH